MSTLIETGVMEVKQLACDKLLEQRVEIKIKNKQVGGILNRLHVATPEPRDNKVRAPQIPESFLHGDKKMTEHEDKVDDFPWPDEPDPSWDPTKFSIDWRKDYLLADESWKYHTIPEIMDGKNIADFVDPDILEKLDQLEREESERLQNEEGDEDDDDDGDDLDLTEEDRIILSAIQDRKIKARKAHSLEKGKNTSALPHKHKTGEVNQFEDHLLELGIDPASAVARARSKSRSKSRGRKRTDRSEGPNSESRSVSRSASRGASRPKTPHQEGFKNKKQKVEAIKKGKVSEGIRNRQAKQGESDRRITTKLPRHLFAGKRGAGKTDRR